MYTSFAILCLRYYWKCWASWSFIPIAQYTKTLWSYFACVAWLVVVTRSIFKSLLSIISLGKHFAAFVCCLGTLKWSWRARWYVSWTTVLVSIGRATDQCDDLLGDEHHYERMSILSRKLFAGNSKAHPCCLDAYHFENQRPPSITHECLWAFAHWYSSWPLSLLFLNFLLLWCS